jgi:hypothetical protein
MNAIQQISLKLQLGIDPLSDISAQELRAMWCEAIDVKFGQRGKANARSAYQNQFAKQIAMQGG